MSVWTIDLCDGFTKVAEVESLAQFNAVVRHNTMGSWRLEAAEAGLSGADLSVVDSIVVRRDTAIVFAGMIRTSGSGAGGITVTEGDDGRRVVLEGADLWAVLASRIVFPTPGTSEPWAAAYNTTTALASTAAWQYATVHLGSGALAARQWPGITLIDALVGPSLAWAGRLIRLDDHITAICNTGGIVCRPRLTAAGTVEISFVAPSDLSASLILSDQGDLVDTVWTRKPAEATWVLGAGQGVGTARTFVSSDSGATGADRIEALYDNTNATSAPQLQSRTTARQLEMAAATTVSTRLTVGASQRFEYLTDYNIGDTVAVELDNVRYPVPVTSVSIELTPGVAVVSPQLGVATSNRLTGLLDDVDELADRFNRQIA